MDHISRNPSVTDTSAERPGFSAGFSFSNFAILVLGAVAGGALAYKFFKGPKANRAVTNQNNIENDIYNSMMDKAVYPATVEENEDRIRDFVARSRAGPRLGRRRLTPKQLRRHVASFARAFNTELGISQI
jgi:hypothetical protein